AADERELALPIARGLLLGELDDVRVTSAPGAEVTARVGAGSFLVEDGEIGAPLEGLSIRAGALAILAGTEALSARPRLIITARKGYPHGTVAPALRTAHVDVT
ncbi:MAG: hypothetical protein QOH17_1099, partial [Pseudonocardiales bacterium]|nr:hypothetical protein [Pseudonocardiales bacterium]